MLPAAPLLQADWFSPGHFHLERETNLAPGAGRVVYSCESLSVRGEKGACMGPTKRSSSARCHRRGGSGGDVGGDPFVAPWGTSTMGGEIVSPKAATKVPPPSSPPPPPPLLYG